MLRKRELILKLIDLGVLFKDLENFNREVEVFQQAYTRSKELGPSNAELQRACLATLANGNSQLLGHYCHQQQWSKALPIYIEAARLYTAYGGPNQDNLVGVYSIAAQVYQHLGKLDLAKQASDRSKSIQAALSARTLEEKKE